MATDTAPAPRRTFERFRFDREELTSPTARFLVRSDIASLFVRVLREGGETVMHAHTANEAIWLVVQGGVTFYDENDQPVAELGPNDGLLVPRGTRYWFSKTSKEDTIILRFGAVAQNDPNTRVNYPKGGEPQVRPDQSSV